MTAQILDCIVSCFRIGDPNGAYPIFDATGSTIAPGRPNVSGRRMIYTSEHYSTALIEKLVHDIGRLPPNEHYHLFGSQMAERAGGSYSQLAFGEINAKAVAAPLIPAGHLGAGVPEARLDIALVDLGKGGQAGAQRMSRKEQFPARPPADRRQYRRPVPSAWQAGDMLACRSTSMGLLSRKLRWKRDTGVAAEFDPGHRGIKAAFDETKRQQNIDWGGDPRSQGTGLRAAMTHSGYGLRKEQDMGSARNSLPQAWIRLTWRARLNSVWGERKRSTSADIAAPNPVKIATLGKILHKSI